jgi:4-hydroxy-tetrahydrodipicolinate reductase
MSRAIAVAAPARGFSVTAAIPGDDLRNGWPRKKGDLKGADVVIDFSGAEAVIANTRRCVDLGLPLVIGTTGWQGMSAEVEGIVLNGEGAMLHSPDFSLTAPLLFHLLAIAGSWLDRTGGFDPWVSEHHHASMKELPSGTSLRMGEILLERMSGKDLLQIGQTGGEGAPNLLSVASARSGSSPGRQLAGFDGEHESLELVHTVRDRGAYAAGALRGAAWLVGRSGVFTMMDVVADLTREIVAGMLEELNDVPE